MKHQPIRHFWHTGLVQAEEVMPLREDTLTSALVGIGMIGIELRIAIPALHAVESLWGRIGKR